MTRAALALALLFAAPARADCRDVADPARVECARDDVRLWIAARVEAEAQRDRAQARAVRLTADLAACEARTCPPPPAVSPWPLVAAGAAGVAVGVLLAVLAGAGS